ncbi:hypothetical protein CDL12_13883 [Handroanthus impetiginosus]|uniref:Uncharacterized protein n=1 Tax=Handroanthus impetiginosus TaxID=429701 RepID=A0A2G9H7J9_9LAMI|nr:hypothetical protein CDL12_13883 [Handroanthus impetiginosus]
MAPENSPPPTAPPLYGAELPPAIAIGIPTAAPPSNYHFMDNRQAPPPAVQVRGGVPGPWSTGLCDCFSDVPNCCITWWCPCITFGQIAEIVDRGSTCK